MLILAKLLQIGLDKSVKICYTVLFPSTDNNVRVGQVTGDTMETNKKYGGLTLKMLENFFAILAEKTEKEFGIEVPPLPVFSDTEEQFFHRPVRWD
ncbi:MAG: hypothetical protein A2725_00495 [Candidatus Magasanikbacteria bacterium RIFCSPHIGHO2_01_FULL_33_34]|uniref:Uncharacterized protein n=1 Tax=Candidatus Magasanikbacteria bacterium RIFCSPHIGHO2_01_FULL_33_34 TaxID=1798671 RepID=A0A1F6LLE2_9BACT|nr:MAG: hypothetical protein A2725_00495 [Candidatus Magasanikbacteria bacterium RIFCSPHIGHO2_01_FULL_33_34]OGH65838.1 MAG: hypothetical protein A3B83_03165 [Candidatus Magasanikbacteria bacterium RIFCSPHIGHO2_02_FULL_33_17]OGH75203.1 MAG: hypothetical protein A3A89_03760 [Candidatus Magasanikbacteria bacterium RIFCSPLOWO2_01_FULL_33_34]